MLDPTLIIELAILGVASGYMAGLLGVGGGMIISPFVTYFLTMRGVPTALAVKMAIATAMATIVFTSISSLRAHHKAGGVCWPIVRVLAPGIALGGGLASIGAFSVLKGSVLAVMFAGLVFFSATQMLRKAPPQAHREMPGAWGQVAAGSLIGFLSGLVGAGGGFVSVPFMVSRNVPMRNAVATSAALGLPIALVNTVGYIISGSQVPNLPPGALGFVWLPGLLVIACCSVLSAPLGAQLAHRLPVPKLKRIFAWILYAIASYMLYKGLVG